MDQIVSRHGFKEQQILSVKFIVLSVRETTQQDFISHLNLILLFRIYISIKQPFF